MLIVLSGLPGVGKTTIARELARATGAVHLRIDCVNPWPLTRGAWRSVAERAGVAALDVEIVCSDTAEHRRRVEGREPDIAGHALPTWHDVVERDYHDWDRDRLVVDTARAGVAACVHAIVDRNAGKCEGRD